MTKTNYILTACAVLTGFLAIGTSLSASSTAAADPVVKQLHSFTNSPEYVTANLVVGPNKYLYGTRSYIAASGDLTTTVYRATVGGAIKTLDTFDFNPYTISDLIVAADGSLIAVVPSADAYHGGAILDIALSGTVTVLYSFSPTSGPSYPSSILIGKDGNYYGTTTSGGTGHYGTVYELTSAAPYQLTVLSNFGQGTGEGPDDLVQAADGTFYGTTNANKGGSGGGTVFEIVAQDKIKTLYSSTHGADINPYGLIQAADGTIYGITTGKDNETGTIFSIDSSSAYSLVYTFTGGADGARPVQLLQQPSTGNIYGFTYAGGEFGDGTFFQLDPTSDEVITFYNFDEPGPTNPAAAALHPNGKFYGMSIMGGADDDGTLFSLNL